MIDSQLDLPTFSSLQAFDDCSIESTDQFLETISKVMCRYLLSEGYIDQNKILNLDRFPTYFPVLNWEQLAEIEYLLGSTRIKRVSSHLKIPNQQVEFTIMKIIDPIRKAFPNIDIQLIGESLNPILKIGDYLDNLFQLLNLKIEQSEKERLFNIKSDTLDIRMVLRGGAPEDIHKIEVFITSFFQLQVAAFTKNDIFYKLETSLYPVSGYLIGIECLPKNSEDSLRKIHFHIGLQNECSCLSLKEQVSWQFVESNGLNPWIPFMEAMMNDGNISKPKDKTNQFSLLHRSTQWSDKVLAQLQYNGMLNYGLKVNQYRLRQFPKINEKQIKLLDFILDKERTKTITDKKTSTKMVIKFSLRELLIRIKLAYKNIEIQITGSTDDYILNEGNYIETLGQLLKIDINVNALKSLFRAEPADLDLRLVLRGGSARDLDILLVFITSYFQLKSSHHLQAYQIFSQFIPPMYPTNTGLIALKCDDEKDSIDLFLELKDPPRFVNESLYLSLDPNQSESSEFKGQNDLSPWLPFIHRITRICSAYQDSDNINLFTLVRGYHKGFRTFDATIEKIAYQRKQKNGNFKQLKDATSIFNAFKKYLSSSPEKAIAYYFQSSLLMHEYGEHNQILDLWRQIQLKGILNDPLLENIYLTLHKSPHLFLEVLLSIQVFCAASFEKKEVVVTPLKVYKTIHNGLFYGELQYPTGFFVIPLRSLSELQRELENRMRQLPEEDRKLIHLFQEKSNL